LAEWKKKAEVPEYHARIKKFAFEPQFEEFVTQSNLQLSRALRIAERSSANRSINQGSLRNYTRTDLSLPFINSPHALVSIEDVNGKVYRETSIARNVPSLPNNSQIN
jgi:hypothetical protein